MTSDTTWDHFYSSLCSLIISIIIFNFVYHLYPLVRAPQTYLQTYPGQGLILVLPSLKFSVQPLVLLQEDRKNCLTIVRTVLVGNVQTLWTQKEKAEIKWVWNKVTAIPQFLEMNLDCGRVTAGCWLNYNLTIYNLINYNQLYEELHTVRHIQWIILIPG